MTEGNSVPQEPVDPWRQPPAYGQQPASGQQPPYGQQPPEPQGQPWGSQPQWGQPPQWGQYAPAGPAFVPQQGGWQQGGYPQYVAPPKPGVIPLRPLNLGEILDGAFQAARRNGKAMFGSALLFQAASALLSTVILIIFATSSPLRSLASGRQPSNNDIATLAVVGSVSLLISIAVSTLGTMVLQGALIVPVARAVLDRGTRFGQMWRLVRPRIGALLLLGLLYMAGSVVLVGILVGVVVAAAMTMGVWSVLVGFILALGAGALTLWLVVKLLVAPAALVVENLGVTAAISRSWSLTSGNWWRTFGVYILAVIIAGVAGGIVSLPVSLLVSLIAGLTNPHPSVADGVVQQLIVQGISAIIGGLVGAITLAFRSGVLALIYLDLRMRKEGFDVVLMKENEGALANDPDGIPGRPSPPLYASGPWSSPQL